MNLSSLRLPDLLIILTGGEFSYTRPMLSTAGCHADRPETIGKIHTPQIGVDRLQLCFHGRSTSTATNLENGWLHLLYGRQHITEEDIEAVTTVLRSEYLTHGPRIKEFDENFASDWQQMTAVGSMTIKWLPSPKKNLTVLNPRCGNDSNQMSQWISVAGKENGKMFQDGNVFSWPNTEVK